MAKVKEIEVKGKTKYAVVHDTTGAVLKRKGRRVIHDTRHEAQKDATATRARVMRSRPRLTHKRPRLTR